jgi:hypothetical protein
MSTDFDLEMQRALEADGEKLRQLTGEDHGPYFFDDVTVYAPCPACFESGGYRGSWHTSWDDPGSFYPNPSDPCPECNGTGQVSCDVAGPDDERAADFDEEGYERAIDAQSNMIAERAS